VSDHAEQIVDLEVKLAYQERLIRELDAHVRELGDRLIKTERELIEIKQAIKTGGEVPLGAATEKPPHY
jgi:uncharacterized coiled-coil protein SlyX